MAADYKLNNEGDLDLSTAAYEFVTGNDQIRQAIQIGLSTDQGEWFENVFSGIPWLSTILTQRGTKDFMDAYIVSYLIDTFPQIEEVVRFDSEINADQTAEIEFTVRLTDGEELTITQEI